MKLKKTIAELLSMTLEQVQEHDEHYLFNSWSCADSALKARGKKLIAMLRAICQANNAGGEDGNRFNEHYCYAYFFNTNRLSGGLYDSIFIMDISTETVLFCIELDDDCFATVTDWNYHRECFHDKRSLLNYFSNK